jgi:general stress protein 26
MNEYSWYNPLYYFSNVEIKVEKEIEKEEKIKLYIVHEEKLENSVKRLFASIVKKSFIELISYKSICNN